MYMYILFIILLINNKVYRKFNCAESILVPNEFWIPLAICVDKLECFGGSASVVSDLLARLIGGSVNDVNVKCKCKCSM